jgi:hypothetical protein
MSATIPASHLDLITGPIVAVFTTVTPKGQPENTVVWCSWDGEHVLVNTADGRRKMENIRNNPKVALTAVDPHDPFRWVDVRGTIVAVEEDADYANTNKHAKLYVNADEYYGGFAPSERKGTERRLILKIRPDRVLAFPPQG